MQDRIIEIFKNREVTCPGSGAPALQARKTFVQFLLSHGIKITPFTVRDCVTKPCLSDLKDYPTLRVGLGSDVIIQCRKADTDSDAITVAEFMDLLLQDPELPFPWENQLPELGGEMGTISQDGKSVSYGCKTITRTQLNQILKLAGEFDIFNFDISGAAPVSIDDLQELKLVWDGLIKKPRKKTSVAPVKKKRRT
jgi:hypothetical protein